MTDSTHSLQQILAPILDTSHTLQNTLQSTNVTMPPEHFFQHLSLSMGYIGVLRTRLRKNRDMMRQKRCYPLHWGMLTSRQEMGKDGQMREVRVLQENSQMQLVEMLSVFRMKGLNEDVPALYWRTQEGDAANSVIGLTPEELALLQSNGRQQGAGMTATTPRGSAKTIQNPIESSKGRIHHIQQEIDDQMEEFEIPTDNSDEREENEHLEDYKEQASDLMRNIIEDEHLLPQIMSFFDEQEERMEQELTPVSILDRNRTEVMVQDPLTPEQRKKLKKRMKDLKFERKVALQGGKILPQKSAPDSQEDFLRRHLYTSRIFDEMLQQGGGE